MLYFSWSYLVPVASCWVWPKRHAPVGEGRGEKRSHDLFFLIEGSIHFFSFKDRISPGSRSHLLTPPSSGCLVLTAVNIPSLNLPGTVPFSLVGRDRKWGGLLVGRGIFLEEERTFHVGKVFEERAAGMQRWMKEGRNRGGGWCQIIGQGIKEMTSLLHACLPLERGTAQHLGSPSLWVLLDDQLSSIAAVQWIVREAWGSQGSRLTLSFCFLNYMKTNCFV